MGLMILIIGLGNPGDKYVDTRHNLGFEVVNELKRKLESSSENQELSWKTEEKFKAEIIRLQHNSNSLILAKPQTFMNKSGISVFKIAAFFKIAPENIIIIHDELDLLLGHMKIRLGGSDAGHHGLESIIKSLGTDKFIRVRLGIGAEKTLSGEHKEVAFNAERFVMEPFLPQERHTVKHITKLALKAIDVILEKGIEKAQNQFN